VIARLLGVSKVYPAAGEDVRALTGVTLDVSPGEVVALMGRSGSGKTTLLNLMGTLDRPTEGRIEIAGVETQSLPEEGLLRLRRETLGFVFQFFNLLPFKNAAENVALPLYYQGVGRKERNRRAEQYLDMVGLSDRKTFMPNQLSGGQKQRVAIARALAGSPPVLLADEPTANLDTAVGGQILDLFQQLAKSEGRGVLVVTHDPNVRRIADRVVGIRDGRLVTDGVEQAAA
jgi:putative ABC transport system ATP-binding protein